MARMMRIGRQRERTREKEQRKHACAGHLDRKRKELSMLGSWKSFGIQSAGVKIGDWDGVVNIPRCGVR